MSSLAVENNHRLLIIDDNRSIHDDFRKILADERAEKTELEQSEASIFDLPATGPARPSFEITSAYQGKEGFDLVREALQAGRPYAMAFMDVRMPPGWDGIETTFRIWEVDPDLQIVICSACADYSWDELTGKLGCSDRFVILKKPFESVEILQFATALTEKWRLGQQSKQQLVHLEREVSERTRDLQNANATLAATNQELEAALAKVKTLSGLLPICSGCKKIRDDQGYWNSIESYIQQHSDARLTHGFCPDCAEHYFPGMS